jgi:hypothetical protein
MRGRDIDCYVVDVLNLAEFQGEPWLAQVEIANCIAYKHAVEVTHKKLGASLLRLEVDMEAISAGWFRLRDGADRDQYCSWDGPYGEEYVSQVVASEYDRVEKYKLREDADVDGFLERIPKRHQKAKLIISGLIRPNALT